jgi:hypothetical protein
MVSADAALQLTDNVCVNLHPDIPYDLYTLDILQLHKKIYKLNLSIQSV